MRVVLADVDEEGLRELTAELTSDGGDVLCVPTDVSRYKDLISLRQKTVEAYGKVDCLFNNAGVGTAAKVWELPMRDWQWILGVNLFSIVYAVQVFVPLMLRQESEGHVVNTASIAGLIPQPGMGAYTVSKYGVVALSEVLYQELKYVRSKIAVSVLCPGPVKTRILEAERNRPEKYRTNRREIQLSPDEEAVARQFAASIVNGMEPDTVVDSVFDAVRKEQLYIVTHTQLKPFIGQRMDDILQERNPFTPQFP